MSTGCSSASRPPSTPTSNRSRSSPRPPAGRPDLATLTWDAVGGNPAPGQPQAFDALARKFSDIAADAADARSKLDRFGQGIDDSVWRGDTAGAFKEKIGELPPRLAKLHDSYATASGGMAGYGRTLQGLQEEARRLLGQAQSAHDEKASQERSRDRARAAEPSASTSVHEDAIDNARSRLDGARDRLDDIRDRRRGAENAAIDKLDDAQDQGIENDPWWKRAWDSVDRWVDEHADILKSISEVLKIVSAVAGVLSFIPVLNFVMGPIALIAGGAALLLDATLAATGNGDWKTLLVDGALMALPGVGRLVSRGVRTGRGGTQFTQVAYGSTRLSRAAINLRRGENMVQNGNVAVARYSRYGIPRKPIAVRNIPRGPGRAGKHSEQVLIETLGGRRGVRVKEVYSELEPCTLNFARCRTKLPEAFPDSKFSYSFEYGGDLTGAAATASRRRGTQALNDAVGGVSGG